MGAKVNVVRKVWDLVSDNGEYTDVVADVDERTVSIGVDNFAGSYSPEELEELIRLLKTAHEWLVAKVNRRD